MMNTIHTLNVAMNSTGVAGNLGVRGNRRQPRLWD